MSKGLIYRLRQGQESLKPACIQANMLIHLPVSPPPHPPHQLTLSSWRSHRKSWGYTCGPAARSRRAPPSHWLAWSPPHRSSPPPLPTSSSTPWSALWTRSGDRGKHVRCPHRKSFLADRWWPSALPCEWSAPSCRPCGSILQQYTQVLLYSMRVECNGTHKYFYIPCEWSATGTHEVLLYSMRVECNSTHKYFYIPCEWSATVHTSTSIFHASGVQQYTRVLLYSMRVECNSTHEYFYIPCEWSATGTHEYFYIPCEWSATGTHEYFYIPCEWSATGTHKYFYIPCEWSATVHTSTSIFYVSGVPVQVFLHSIQRKKDTNNKNQQWCSLPRRNLPNTYSEWFCRPISSSFYLPPWHGKTSIFHHSTE